MLDKVEEAKGSICLMSGRFKKEELLGLLGLLPIVIMPHIAEVEKAVADIVQIDDDWVPNKQAKPVLSMLVDVAADACNFRAPSEPAAATSAKAEKRAGDRRFCVGCGGWTCTVRPLRTGGVIGHKGVAPV